MELRLASARRATTTAVTRRTTHAADLTAAGKTANITTNYGANFPLFPWQHMAAELLAMDAEAAYSGPPEA